MSCHYGHRRAEAWPQQMQQWAQQMNQQVNRNVRIGDAERDQAATALAEHFSAGRLDREEYDERLEAIFAARVDSDLNAVFRDLPRAHTGPQRRSAPVAFRPRMRIPFLPVMLIVIGLIMFTGAWWLVWVGLGVLLLGNKFSQTRHRSRMAAAHY